MSSSIHFICVPGSGPPDGGCLPCSGLSGRALGISPNSSHANYILIPNIKFLSLKHSPRHIACNASSSIYRRNQDSPDGQNNRKFSRNRNNNNNNNSNNNNRHTNERRDGYEDQEAPSTFSSRNGPLFSVSPNQKFQATATPGPREKEIVELFKKVQAQLRERAAVKEEGKKVENSQGKSKGSDTVDSLLKLLRKHSVQQGNKSYVSSENRDFILDQEEELVGTTTEAKSTSIPDTADLVKPEVQESQARPKSSFRKRSPVPEIKFQPIYSEGLDNSDLPEDLDSVKSHEASLEQEEVESESESDSESDVDPIFPEDSNELDEISDDEISEFYENGHGGVVEEETPVGAAGDLSGMKLTELRALAKARGMKGYSKLKKSDLLELLNG